MKKIYIFFTIIGILCFICCLVKTFNTFINIIEDTDYKIFVYLGQKNYDKKYVLLCIKQILRYIYYFIFFKDIGEVIDI